MQMHGEGQAPPIMQMFRGGWGVLCVPGAHGRVCPSVRVSWTQECLCVRLSRPKGCPSVRCPAVPAVRQPAAKGRWEPACSWDPDRRLSGASVRLWQSGAVRPECHSVLATWGLPKLPASPVCSSWARGCSEPGPEAVPGGTGAGRLLYWQHRVLVASGVKWPQRPRAPSGPRPGSDPPRGAAAPGGAAGPVAIGGRGKGGAGPGSVPADPRSHNGDAGLRKMAAGGRGPPRCPRAVHCARALRAVVGRMRTPPRASSCRAAREAPCGHHGGVRRGHQCPPAALRRAGQRSRPGRRLNSAEHPADDGLLRAAPEIEAKLRVM